MASPLEDLDELTLRCRDEKAKAHIAEAVASYRAGAFRSAIVATWIAVCFDIIEKLRELALAGDAAAEQQVQNIDKTHRTNDLTAALKFEREFLGLVKDKFELLSQIEYEDLKRLQEDRNRCAHPSLSSDQQAYNPPAELARLHIHSAVIHLLQHPPVQGKYALERILKEIDSDYFPTTEEDAKIVLNAGPLRRPRESLLRSVVIVLCKEQLKTNIRAKRRSKLAAALQAIGSIHPASSSKIKQDILPKLFRELDDAELYAATTFLKYAHDIWQYLADDNRLRFQNCVENLGPDQLHKLDFFLNYQPLRQSALKRIQRANMNDLEGLWLFMELPPEIVERYIHIYLLSDSYEKANEWGKEMCHITEFISEDQVRMLLEKAAENNQITNSFQFATFIARLRSTNKIPEDEFEVLLQENDLEQYCLINQLKYI